MADTSVRDLHPEVAPSDEDKALMRDGATALGIVIRLFDRELDRDALAALARDEVAGFVAGLFDGPQMQAALAEFRAALDALGPAPEAARLDLVAADYADIFLTHGHRAAPTASVWLSEDHTESNEPMFAARAWYAHWGVRVPDWRMRADDHIVAMLEFVQLLLENGDGAALVDAAVFLDSQMGPWVGDFLGRVAAQADEPLYRAAATLCAAMLAEIRAELARITGIKEDIPPPPKRPEIQPDEPAFLPGASPSW